MLLFINNVNPTELLLIAVVAVLVFGRKLPEVAGQAAAQLAKARRAINDMRRESGLDEELRRARSAAQELDPRRVLEAPRPARALDGVARQRAPIAPTETREPAVQGAEQSALAPTTTSAFAAQNGAGQANEPVAPDASAAATKQPDEEPGSQP
jgi:Sec-independent protein translocase protein TatA